MPARRLPCCREHVGARWPPRRREPDLLPVRPVHGRLPERRRPRRRTAARHAPAPRRAGRAAARRARTSGAAPAAARAPPSAPWTSTSPAALARLRALERAPRRPALPRARRGAGRRPPARRPRQDRLDGLRRGHGRPRPCAGDVVGAAGAAARLDGAGPRWRRRRRRRRGRTDTRRRRRRCPVSGTARRRLRRGRFYPGCALRQDRSRSSPSRARRPRLGLPLGEPAGARAAATPAAARRAGALCQRRDVHHRLSGLRPQPERERRRPTTPAVGGARRPARGARGRAPARGRARPSCPTSAAWPSATRALDAPGRRRQPWRVVTV